MPISEVTHVQASLREQTIHHKDMLPVVYVTADVAGPTDSPLYGLADIYRQLNQTPIAGSMIKQYLNSQPENPFYGV